MALPGTGKLIRDKIPQIIRDSGRHPQVVVIGDDDLRSALEMKLQEEVGELLAAPEESRLEELADVYEVLLALTHEIAVTEQQLHQTALAKRDDRGAFVDQLWLLDIRDR